MEYYIWKSYRFKEDPLFIFNAIKERKYCFFLDSSLYSPDYGRYSFLGFEPFFILKTKNSNPFRQIRNLLKKYRISKKIFNFPFWGGAVGFLGYDLGFVLEEKLSKRIPDDLDLPDCFFGFYSAGIIIDHKLNKLYIFSLGFPEKNYFPARRYAEEKFNKIEKILCGIDFRKKFFLNFINSDSELDVFSNFDRQQYIEMVKKAKDYIRKGDIYQVNLSQRFEVKGSKKPFEVYVKLRSINPSFYSAYIDAGDFQLISSSPEEFLKARGNLVITRPMKGTRRRAQDKKHDRYLKRQLLRSQKDKAELIMIVDLERNDLGKVCRYHSVKVEKLRVLEEYRTVFQATSTIRGILHPQKDIVDLICACFPGGSITGCPKIRAMQIIEELETRRRSFYTGALGYLSFTQDMHLNIIIRTILKKGDRFYFGVGGGIVADSIPEKEYNETLVKAKAMFEALR